MGAGAAEGAMDASNLLKPMLARGELHTIGATTLDEYRKHIEKDAALERRFQPIVVDQPTRRGDHLDPARPAREVRGSPRRPHHGLRAGGRGDALQSLHHRPLPAGQGDRPGGRGGKPAAHGDRLDADRARRARAPADPARDRARGTAQGDGRRVEGAPGDPGAGAGRDRRAGRGDEAALDNGEGRHSADPSHQRRRSRRCRSGSIRPSARPTSAPPPSSSTASCPSSRTG